MENNLIFDEYINIHKKQKEIVKELKSEDLDDLHSILRSKNLIENYLTMQIKLETLIKYVTK